MKSALRVLLALLFAFAAIPVTAGVIVVDPDLFPLGTDLTSAFPGLSLTAVGSGWGGNNGRIYGVDPTSQNEPFTPATGRLVFGTSDPSFPHLFMDAAYVQMRVDFSAPTSYVAIHFIGNDSSDIGMLSAYDSGGGLLASITTASLGLNEVQKLSVSNPGIAYAIFGGDSSSSSIGLDMMLYEGVPEPSSVALALTGLIAGLSLRRLRR